MNALEQRLSRLEGNLPPRDGDPDLVRVYQFEDGSEERLYMLRGHALWTERTEPDPAA